mmetsp:Transcript_36561/g.95707  ORF Transcript_36561/g.95707 Transcript_36561/m.95707 type:complete len:212 (-) Transcript_36561:1189-1824(-)
MSRGYNLQFLRVKIQNLLQSTATRALCRCTSDRAPTTVRSTRRDLRRLAASAVPATFERQRRCPPKKRMHQGLPRCTGWVRRFQMRPVKSRSPRQAPTTTLCPYGKPWLHPFGSCCTRPSIGSVPPPTARQTDSQPRPRTLWCTIAPCAPFPTARGSSKKCLCRTCRRRLSSFRPGCLGHPRAYGCRHASRPWGQPLRTTCGTCNTLCYRG